MNNPKHFQLGIDAIPDWAMDAISANRLILNRDKDIYSPFDHNYKTNAFIYEEDYKQYVQHGDYIILKGDGKLDFIDEALFRKLYITKENLSEKDNLLDLIGNLKENEYVVIYQFNSLNKVTVIISKDKPQLMSIANLYNNKLHNKFNLDKIVHVSKTDNLSDYFKSDTQTAISNRIYELTGIKV